MITTNFYNTDPKEIDKYSREIFGKPVCLTCHIQLVEAYQNIKSYYLNMAKQEKKQEAIEVELTLKKEFIGSTYSNGSVSVFLSDLTLDEAKKVLTRAEILTHFE